MKIIISLTLVYLLFFPAKFLLQPQEIIDAYNLQNAIRSSNIDEINLLLADGIDVNIQYNGRNALHVACEGGSAEIVRLILSRGADVNARRDNGDGLTTLQNAIQGFNCSLEIINILLEKGSEVNAIGPNGSLAINDAIRKSGDKTESMEILKLLLKFKAEVDPNIEQNSPVINSILHRRSDMLEVLLKHNADPNKIGKNSKSPLHYAVENRDIDAVKLLKKYSAEIHIKNSDGESPLEYAVKMSNKTALDPVSKKKYKEIVDILSK
jgi:ankyrin repeat protein